MKTLTRFVVGVLLGMVLHKFTRSNHPCKAVHLAAQNQTIYQKSIDKQRKRVLIGILSSKSFMATRGRALYSNWLKEVPSWFGDILFFSEPGDNDLPTVKLRNVNDSVYPPQQKSFQMLAYFNDKLKDKYDWFIRLDDDSVLQWENLNELLVKLDPDNKTLIGSPGYGRDEDDFIEENMVYCMGGTGIIYSNALVRAIRPHLTTCIKQLYTEHEDIEICRCIWRYTSTKCTSSRSKYFFQNWAKNVPLGGIGYKTNIDPTNDLTNYIIDSAIVMHAVKNPDTHTEIRKRVLAKRIANYQVKGFLSTLVLFLAKF